MTTLLDPPTLIPERPLEPASAPRESSSSYEPQRLEKRRNLRSRTEDDVLCLLGSAVGSLMLTYVLYEDLLPTKGKLGFVLVYFFLFLVTYAAITAVSNPRPVVVDRVVSTLVQAGAAIVALALASATIYTFAKGHSAFLHVNFFTRTMSGVGPNDPLSRGGILHAIVGTLFEIGIAVIITLPLGVGTAIFMTEIGGPLARVVRTVVEAMTALPSIVAGLFIYSTLIVGFHGHRIPRSGFAAAMALSVMILPIIARSADVVLRVVPGGLRQAGLALGAPLWRVVWHVVLPTARSGLATALILGIARGIGETSPVLLTSGASTFFNDNPLKDPMNSLPLFIFSSVRSGEPLYITRGFGAASVLLALVLILFIGTRLLARGRATR